MVSCVIETSDKADTFVVQDLLSGRSAIAGWVTRRLLLGPESFPSPPTRF